MDATGHLENELSEELENILQYWMRHTIDHKNGGFIGQIDFQDNPHENAEKGAVMNARILWAFSAAYQFSGNDAYKTTAKRAFNYIVDHFYDTKNGGIFWSLNSDGTPKDTKNQIYALAFVIYGLSEYYAVSHDVKALAMAIDLYRQIEKYSFDPLNKGYFEAFTRDWKPIEDLRLSDKDVNESKTMNTHLHIVEAYANLYSVWKNDGLKQHTIDLLDTINTHFINRETGHLKLFFDDRWNEHPDVISYGHDIEAAWLLQHCAEITGDAGLVEIFREHALQIANATKEGIDGDGGLWYELNPKTNETVREKHSWPQAELLIGFVNAWQLTGNMDYLDIAKKNWTFIKKHLIDKENGEWFWGINDDYSQMKKDKAGFWKCCYHNTRACLEVINRLKKNSYEITNP